MNYAFGHGLSYTTFTLGKPQLSTSTLSGSDDTITVTVPVSNTGNRAGSEVIQIYVHDKKSSLPRPYKELKAFKKVKINPGETVNATLTLDKNAFAYFDDKRQQWIVEPGEFEILIGTASDAISACLPIEISAPGIAWHD